ncbi:right-handed parallel beta-helix repeat-containing protein [Sphingomonas sp. RHCKR7]|uniref:right-handed parallel beta-helix repeat-containing protein n=1 Tax=Sphingomonas folli TaxID=2862497 RepID=UPI001CA59283|nr:right-handed parallel beta-helix repeat-containing protein [Sphingomonas folli]MBW6526484.1 right-handed parallel beta-helix repeat-containing protein [Sphingomonas folli]
MLIDRAVPVLLAAAATAPALAQQTPAPVIPTFVPSAADRAHSPGVIHISRRPTPVPVVIHVSPHGSDDGDGSVARPYGSLTRAQAAVRRLNGDHDVTVELGDGLYPLRAPLRFGAPDGGQNGYVVRWQAASGAHPVLSGGTRVTGWTLADAARGIWSAAVPQGFDPRQLWVDGHMASRAAVRAPRTAFAFHDWGMEIKDPAWRFLADLPDQRRIEAESTGWFTDRHAMVERVEGDRIVMQQPGWRNNIVGYDTFARSVWGDNAGLFFVNSLAFLREPGQYFADPGAGKIYYKPRAGEDVARLEVVLPRLESLMSIAGSYADPIRDLHFIGLSFRHTSWLFPNGPEGYASQQSGSYLVGDWAGYPKDPIRDCSWGCWPFEAMRNRWNQQPAAVQVAAATRVIFDHDEFTQLGQIGLGIGNNPDANESGIGLGASAIEVRRSRFTDLAGGAIMVGGVRADAHHPSDPAMTVRDILISNNIVKTVSQHYREQAAILVTYASAATIWHNDVSGTPYDGIDVGWGWGTNDPGGSSAYMTANRGYYDQPGNLIYNTPTILHDTVVVGNRVHDVKQWFPDGGAIYHLSADPGALIAENYVYDVKDGIALYLDEGSRYVTMRDDVISDVGVWLNLNSQNDIAPRRTALDNNVFGNWYDSGRRSGAWTDYLHNSETGNTLVRKGTWPAGARDVIARSGPEAEAK